MLSAHDLDGYRKQLLAMRDQMEMRLPRLHEEASHSTGGESAGGLSNAPLHLAELGAQEAVEVVNIALAENDAAMRQEIEDALVRLDDGTFGICEECHAEIAPQRLQAVPYSQLCIQCANLLHRRAGP